MPPAEVRDLRPADIPRILQLEADLFGPEAWTARMYREELSNPFRAYRGIEVCGVLVAYGGVLVDDDGQILTIGVDRAHQRRGLGAMLLEDLLAILADRGAEAVFLEVRASDDGAQRLYRRHGFVTIGRRRNYYERIGEDALIMRVAVRRVADGGPAT